MKRHALFVGVNTYDDTSICPLRYSITDASVLEHEFKCLGFKTWLLTDPDQAKLKRTMVESVKGLGPGDVFLFFFAGHGFTAQDGAHLLFCKDDRKELLRVNSAGIRVDALELLTDKGGFNRAFLLDSCRSDWFAGMQCRGGGILRDLDFVPVTDETEASGSFFLLRSCDKFSPSLELDCFSHGLFTQGLLNALEARDAGLASCNTAFAETVAVRMADLQSRLEIDFAQRPSVGNCCGPAFSLFESGMFEVAPNIASQHTPQRQPHQPMPPPPRIPVQPGGVILPTRIVDRYIFFLSKCGFTDEVMEIKSQCEEVRENGERSGWRVCDAGAFAALVSSVPKPPVLEIMEKGAEHLRQEIRNWFLNRNIRKQFGVAEADALRAIFNSISREGDRR